MKSSAWIGAACHGRGRKSLAPLRPIVRLIASVAWAVVAVAIVASAMTAGAVAIGWDRVASVLAWVFGVGAFAGVALRVVAGRLRADQLVSRGS